jgi:hypothetical protein
MTNDKFIASIGGVAMLLKRAILETDNIQRLARGRW